MSLSQKIRRLRFAASLLATSIIVAGNVSGQDEPQRQATATSKPATRQVSSSQFARPSTNTSRKGTVAKPTRNEPVRVATARHSGTVSKDSVVQASCKSCAPVQIASEPIAMIHEEPSEVGISDVVRDPNAFQFQHDGCDSCGPNNVASVSVLGVLLRNAQFRIEAATFWGDGQVLQPLVTTRRPASDPATDGLIGRADTIVLFGGQEMLDDSVQGIRGEASLFLDPCRSRSLLFRYFNTSTNSDSFNSAGSIDPVVMRPFFSTADNAQSTIAINYPNSTSGSVAASLSSDVYGGDVLFRKMVSRNCGGQLDFLAGYQMARLEEQLLIDSSTTALTNTSAPVGTVSRLTDSFSTSNRFHGIAFGLDGMLREGPWSLHGLFKLGFGNMERIVNIQGSSQITVPGTPPTTNSTTNGLLARSTNEGRYQFDTVVASPELGLTLGYRFTRSLDVTLSYNYLGIPKVGRVGDQLDPRLASNLSSPLSGDLTPRFSFAESNFSLHSLSYGLQWQY